MPSPLETVFAGNELTLNVLLVGVKAAGKRSLLRAIEQRLREEQSGTTVFHPAQGWTLGSLAVDMGSIRGFHSVIKLVAASPTAEARRFLCRASHAYLVVIDSSRDRLAEQERFLRAMENELKAAPAVLLFNKRDLTGAIPREELEAQLNWPGLPACETTATTGEGVIDTLKAVFAVSLQWIESRGGGG